MAGKSSIEWTEHTWNPMTGCTKVSPGCKNCYAEVMARRLQAMGACGYEHGFALTLHPERLRQPLGRRSPTVYFVNSMSDLFHEDVPYAYLDDVFRVMEMAHRHVFQVLTKRAERMHVYFERRRCPQNVWIGVSVEDRRYGVPRIRWLQNTDAPVRFLSCEPLLEDLGVLDLSGIDWMIVGGESGHRARPMRVEWVVHLRDQAAAAGVAFFFKQWGTYGPDGVRRSKKANGRLLDGRTWDAMPALQS